MKKNSTLASLSLSNVLTIKQMSLVKGGLDTTVPPITSAINDDKRRERPGGGITTI